jgi:hypothetical protein
LVFFGGVTLDERVGGLVVLVLGGVLVGTRVRRLVGARVGE